MIDQKSAPLTRSTIAEFINTPRGIRTFEAMQADTANIYSAIQQASFLTLDTSQDLGSERVLTPATGEITGTDAGAGLAYTLGLADTAVVPGSYGDNGGAGAANFVTATVDQKGRLTSAGTFTITTGNVPEGSNLYYTDARARAAISAGAGINYDNTTGVITAKSAGTYGAPTGTLSRAAFATYTAGTTLTFSAAYVQAELTALATRLAAVEAALSTISRIGGALVTDMKANGNIT